MKNVYFIKKVFLFSLCLIFLSLLPTPVTNSVVAKASEVNTGDNNKDAKLNVKTVTLVKDTSYTLRVYNTTDSAKVSFKSDDDSIASVDTGKNNTATVTGIGVGTTKITIQVKDGRNSSSLECEVIVGPPMISYVFNQSTVTMGVNKKKTLGAIIRPSNTTEQPYFTSSNENVATVSQTGRVSTITSGKATITAFYGNNKKDTCVVVVDSSINDNSDE
jgi:Bacterial Ig-like domain (group 2).